MILHFSLVLGEVKTYSIHFDFVFNPPLHNTQSDTLLLYFTMIITFTSPASGSLNIFHPSHCLGFCNVLSCSALISSRFMYQASRGKFHYVSYVSLKWIFVLMIGVGKVFFCYSIQLSFLLMSDFVCIINVAFMLPLIGNLEIGKI